MKQIIFILFWFSLISVEISASGFGQNPEITAKHVRQFINKGNQYYRNGNFAEAETSYKNALQEDPNSALAKFNLALALLKQQTANKAQSDTLRLMSRSYFQEVAGSSSANESLIEKSYYNLGNISFDEENYANSIEMYKEVLRRNPNNIAARQNLRVAQIKLKDQQNNQGKDNQDQKQEQEQKQQQQQQEQKEQNQNNNQSQQQEQNKKEEEQQQQNSAANNQQNQPKEQDKNKSGSSASKPQISEENADKILKAAAKQEEQTRKKVEMRQQENTARQIIGNPW